MRREKERVRREIRVWREGNEYKRKREYRVLCEKKKKEENDRWEKRAAEARRENEVWEIVNKKRKHGGMERKFYGVSERSGKEGNQRKEGKRKEIGRREGRQ